MTAPTLATHPCNPDPFAICECGRPGMKTFSVAPAPWTAGFIEATFEFVEAQADDATFTEKDVVGECWAVRDAFRRSIYPGSTVGKALRLMEHHGLIERAGNRGRAILWRRALPVGAAS